LTLIAVKTSRATTAPDRDSPYQIRFAQLAPKAGITPTGVGYGVLLNGAVPPKGERVSIDEVTRQVVENMQQNNGAQTTGNPQPISAAGVQGRSVSLQSTSPFPAASGQAQKERDWLVTLPRSDGSVIFMVFVAPESEFVRFQPTYEAMVKSVRF
jgi:hypothetical protein